MQGELTFNIQNFLGWQLFPSGYSYDFNDAAVLL